MGGGAGLARPRLWTATVVMNVAAIPAAAAPAEGLEITWVSYEVKHAFPIFGYQEYKKQRSLPLHSVLWTI